MQVFLMLLLPHPPSMSIRAMQWIVATTRLFLRPILHGPIVEMLAITLFPFLEWVSTAS